MNALDPTPFLPEPFTRWFAARGWTPRAHQLELLAKARAGRSVLLIAPTGAGKTLAGFLPSLVELSAAAPRSRSIPLPPPQARLRASSTRYGGGEGLGVGGNSHRDERPPTPDPSPPFAARTGGGERTVLAAQAGATPAPPAHLHRPRHPPRGRSAHALHLSAQGAGSRHRAQPRAAGGRDGAADPHRDPYRRHACIKAPAPAARPAAYSAHHARAACVDPCLARCTVFVRLAAAHRAR